MILRPLRLVVPLFPLLAGCTRYQPLALDRAAVEKALTVSPEARALSPDDAALLAVMLNPSLRAERDRRALASAQLIQAGILPNPQIDFGLDPVTGGNTTDTVTGYDVAVSWEVTSLLTHGAKVAAAKAGTASVQLDVAWMEWQIAQAAKKAVYDLVAARAQLLEAQGVDQRLAENRSLLRNAVESHEKTVLELSAADAAFHKAHADLLAQQGEVRRQTLLLNQAMGLAPEAAIDLRADIALPSSLSLPDERLLCDQMEQHRLDLLGLKRGYESQEQTLRSAVLAQFPKITLGFHQTSDTSNVHTTGFGVSIDLPIFDRNQGSIAVEKATRQKLFDEYINRVYEGRAAIAQGLDDSRSLIGQIAAAQASIPSLEQLVQTYAAALRQGNVDVLSYYAAQNDLAEKRMDVIKLKQQLMENRIALEIASGQYLPSAVSATTATTATTAPAAQELH